MMSRMEIVYMAVMTATMEINVGTSVARDVFLFLLRLQVIL